MHKIQKHLSIDVIDTAHHNPLQAYRYQLQNHSFTKKIHTNHIDAHRSIREQTRAHRGTEVHMGVYWCTLVHTRAKRSTLVHKGAQRCTREHTGAHRSTQVHTGAHGSTFHNGGARQSSAAWRLEGLRVIEASGPIITVTPSPPYWEPSTIWTFYTIYKYISS